MEAPAGVAVIGGSAGALESLISITAGLPADYPAAILVVIHTPPARENLLADIVARRSALPASAALHGEPIGAGRIYVAPSDRHLMVQDGHLHLSRGPKENGHRPAIDPLFRTAAAAYGPAVTGVILSGNRDDGSVGLQVIRRRGGLAIVEDPAEALFPEMPQNAIEAAGPQHVVPTAGILRLLTEFAGRLKKEEAAMTTGGTPSGSSDRPAPAIGAEDVNGTPTGLSCPECHGVIWASANPDEAPYRCRTGHAFSSESLLDVQEEALEEALWAAVRSLQEHASLTQNLSRRAERRGDVRNGRSFADRSKSAAQHARIIQDMLVNQEEKATARSDGG